MNNRLRDAIGDPEKWAARFTNAEHALTRLFWVTVAQTGVSERLWNRMMDKYVRDPRFVDQTNHRRKSAPGNLGDAVSGINRAVNWKGIIRGWRLLGFVRCRLRVVLYREGEVDGLVTEVEFDISDANTTPGDTESSNKE